MRDTMEEDRARYEGWRVTAAAFVGVMVSFAAMVPFTFSLFLAPLAGAFGWKREAISRAFAIAALTVAACSPAIGALLDKFPPRRVILPSITVFAAAMASLASLHGSILRYYATYLVLGIVGNGTAQLAYSRAVLTWFDEKRGMAIALVLTGSATGSIVLPILAQHTMASYGWRAAYAVLGVVALLGLPLTSLLVRNRPEAASTKLSPASSEPIVRLFRTRVFWLIAFPVMLSALSLNATIAHLAAILTSRGVSGSTAALALSMLGVAGILGRLITGHFLDRVFAPYVSLMVLLIATAGLMVEAYASSSAASLFGASFLGFGAGSEADVVPYLVSRYFGQARFSLLYGLSWTAYAIGGALGPLLMGHIYDRSGAYTPASLLLLAAPCFVAALLQLLLPRFHRNSLSRSAGQYSATLVAAATGTTKSI